MANLIDTDLLLDSFSERMQTTLGPMLAPLQAFTKDFTPDTMVQQSKALQVPVFNSTAVAVQSNPTNFETGDTNTTNAIISVNHLSRSFFLASSTLNQKFRIDDLIDINFQTFANKLIDTALTPVTVTNFGANQNIIVTQANITTTSLKSAWAGVAQAPVKNLILDAASMSAFLPTSLTAYGSAGTGQGYSEGTKTGINLRGLCGFDNVYLNTRWTGAGGNVYGFACAPQAIGLVAGIPVKGPSSGDYMASRIVQVPQLNLSVECNTWYSVASRQQWMSFDVMFGAGFLQDSAAGFVIASA